MKAWITSLLYPISSEYEHLKQDFFAESTHMIQRIMRLSGIIYLLSIILIGLIANDPYLQIPELILLDIANVTVSFCCIIFSHRVQNRQTLYRIFFVGLLVIVYTNMRESMIEGKYMSLFLIAMSGSFVGALTPWPSIWTAGLQAIVALSCASMASYWSLELVGPLITIFLFCVSSLSIHLFITHQRWQGFLNRYHIQLLNNELQTVNHQLRQHTERLEQELALARHIQQGLLLPPCPTWPHLDVVCYSQPALEIGGDFYSYHTLHNEKVIVAVGDVSGKGAAAALLMAATLSLFSSTLTRKLTPSERLAFLDGELVAYTRTRRQNCALCFIELDGDNLYIVNAGGIPPYIRRKNGGVEWPNVCGFALGQGLGAKLGYQETQIALSTGDLVILTSDGFVETKNRQGEMFGFERLEESIASGPVDNAQAMLNYLLQILTDFADGSDPHDDVTVVVFRMVA